MGCLGRTPIKSIAATTRCDGAVPGFTRINRLLAGRSDGRATIGPQEQARSDDQPGDEDQQKH